MSIQDHWSVTSRTYSGDGVVLGPHTVTEFAFSNGVSLRYREERQELEIHLPVKEAILSSGRADEEVGDDQIGVRLMRIHDVVAGISIYPPEGES